MASVIIDGRNAKGERCSASVPAYMWDLFVLSCSEKNPAKPMARGWLQGMVKDYSEQMQLRIIRQIAKPSLVQQWEKTLEVQTDLEDY